jgi:tight adherence protein B
MTRRLLLLLVLGLGTCSLLAFPAGPAVADQGVQIRSVDTAGFPNVLVTVGVPGNVQPGAVRLTENGYPVQVITARSLVDAGGSLSIVLAIDTSNSVRGAALATAVQAATTFVDQLPAGLPVGLLTFADQPRVLAPVQADHQAVLAALEGLVTTQAGTTVYDGVEAAAHMFSGSGQRDVVLLTDGADTRSAGTIDSAVAAARAAHAAVFTVGLGSKVDTPVLQGIATGTGGSYTPAAQANLISIYQSLAQQLSHQYVIQYRSHAPGSVQVTIGVQAGDGSDQRFVQMPSVAAPPAESALHRAIFGVWGMVGVLVLFFGAIFMVGVILAGSGSRARRDRELARRMSAPPPRPDSAVREEATTSWIPESLASAGTAVAEVGGFEASLERKLERAGVVITPGEFVAVTVGSVLLGGLIGGLVLRSVLWTLVLVAVAAILPRYLLGRRLHKRIDALHGQLPDVLMILASSMRAGHSFLQALDTVSKEVGEPSGPEFARLVSEMRLGRSPDEALNALADRVDTEEFKWAMMAVNVQREVGGNMAELLDTLATTVREREVVRRQVRVLSAEGRLSMWLLAAIPPGLALYIAWVNPTYMKLLWTTKVGFGLLAAGAILMSVGVLVARKIVRIDV